MTKQPKAIDPIQIEATLIAAVERLERPGYQGRGRPQILSPAVLWSSLVLALVNGRPSQSAVWRLVQDRNLWKTMAADVTDEAVFKRLASADPTPFASLFAEITALLQDQVAPWQETILAPFASTVVALDNTCLDKAVRNLREPRDAPVQLPGQLATRFNLRTRLWERVLPIANAAQNEKVTARPLIADLPERSLILADRGFFSFTWFDDLTDAGHFWISRIPAKVSLQVVHTLIDRPDYRDELVFLGAYRADRSKYLARCITVQIGSNTWQYLTNVLDPTLLTVQDIGVLYARRWDIEIAFRTLKVDLKLRVIWSTKWEVVQHQVWAVLLIAQIVQTLRVLIAGRAGVTVDEVSLSLLISDFPKYVAHADDPIAAYIADGRKLRYIRPSRRITITMPHASPADFTMPPPNLIATQKPRYAPRPNRLRPQPETN